MKYLVRSFNRVSSVVFTSCPFIHHVPGPLLDKVVTFPKYSHRLAVICCVAGDIGLQRRPLGPLCVCLCVFTHWQILVVITSSS